MVTDRFIYSIPYIRYVLYYVNDQTTVNMLNTTFIFSIVPFGETHVLKFYSNNESNDW